MNIKEMHDLFRVVGQQVGMQLVRGILPKHIDSFINIEIGEVVKKELLVNANISQDGSNLQSVNLSSTNAFRTLYRKDVFDVKDKSYFTIVDDHYKFILPNEINTNNNKDLFGDNIVINPLIYLGFNIQYDYNNNFTSCRLINSSVLETTLKDFCNSPDEQNPISVLIAETGKSDNKYYNKECVEFYTNSLNNNINKISVSYIKHPNIVKWDEVDTNCINCDLPEHMHYDIINGAVNRYLLAINSQPATTNNIRNNN